MRHDRPYLLNPGPVNVHADVRSALAGPDWCHRESEYFELQDRVRSGIVQTLGLGAAPSAGWAAVLLAGSGTCAVEAMVSSLVPRHGSLLVLSNGTYGRRIAEMGRAAGIDVVELESDPDREPDLDRIERTILDARARGIGLTTIAAVHHETTLGMLNPISEIGAIARRHDLTFLVDAVSSLGGEPIDLESCGVDAAACVANKCFEGIAGTSFVLLRRDALRRHPLRARSVYLDLPAHLARQDAGDTMFTPAVQVVMALDAAVHRLAIETVRGRAARYARCARIVREHAARAGLRLWLPVELRSNTITTIALPNGVGYERLHEAMRAAGFVIYAGQGAYRELAFRIATMGQLPEAEIERAMGVLAQVVEAHRGW